jgi:hypothetical protein
LIYRDIQVQKSRINEIKSMCADWDDLSHPQDCFARRPESEVEIDDRTSSNPRRFTARPHAISRQRPSVTAAGSRRANPTKQQTNMPDGLMAGGWVTGRIIRPVIGPTQRR